MANNRPRRVRNHAPTIVWIQRPGEARCHCGSLLCYVAATSHVELKCRRCARLVQVRMAIPPAGADNPVSLLSSGDGDSAKACK